MRLIDMDPLLEKAWHVGCRTGYVQVVDVEDIRKAPVIEVVRCLNCEHWYPEEDDVWGHCRRHDFWSSKTWFCADGERREDEG